MIIRVLPPVVCALVAGAVLGACGSDAAPSATSDVTIGATSGVGVDGETPTATITIDYADGVIDDPSRRTVSNGAEVTLVVTSDVADQVHVHGFDLFASVEPGRPAELLFIANNAGVWEVELEGSQLALFELLVER